jgi:hypothetical protein
MAREQDRREDLTAFEAALAALRPRDDVLDRDRLMFLAGQVSVQSSDAGAVGSRGSRRHRWGWPAAFGAMTTIAAGLLVTLAVRPPRTVERIVEVRVAPPAVLVARADHQDRPVRSDDDEIALAAQREIEQTSGWMALFWASFEKPPSMSLSATDASRYLRLRDVAFSRGLDAWPTSTAVAGPSVSSPSRPASRRELLTELLELPEATPESTSHPGAKS